MKPVSNFDKKFFLVLAALFVLCYFGCIEDKWLLALLLDLPLFCIIGKISEAADLLVEPTQEKVDVYLEAVNMMVEKKKLDILDTNALVRRDLFCLTQKQINALKAFLSFEYEVTEKTHRFLLDVLKMQLELF